MSEPVKPRDVDEVLTSIRRLVGDEAVAVRPGRIDAAPDRLILTPALRVAAAGSAGWAADVSRKVVPDTAVEPDAAAAAAAAAAADAATLEQRIAELEAAVAGCDGDWEPDGTDPPLAATGWAASGAERSPASTPDGDVRDRNSRAAAANSGPGPRADAAAEEAGTIVVDKEMLRDLVAEILRQELQGQLGERITLNMRKLVRREINRALALRDLD
ncbi:hypothetical protein [Rhodovulum euryhalinum]|uniref:Uncharacterized protein n=1 Tax=Rhodovulum euryhalinum TaxID=35805 RepID=A0A4R2K7I4_9RHOB|nr:hypothetical protein [Rhodovulum euryhalinum]TCO69313.1 hypothetical protein EV655_11641 [Rhodovulum euryhalinum]